VVPASGGGDVCHQFAFLPLISDPDSQDKYRLFQELDFHEVELAADAPHPPVFACVMRRAGVPKQLECHGFVCSSSEDAIIIAANLYQALLETMKRQKASSKVGQQQKAFRRSMRQKSGRRVAQPRPEPSVEESVEDGDEWEEEDETAESVQLPASSPDSIQAAPVRPPRKKRRAPQHSSDQNGLQRKKSTRGSLRNGRVNKSNGGVSLTVDPTRRAARALARVDSGRSSFARRSSVRKSKKGSRPALAAVEKPSTTFPQNGDVYTRVAIPRSKSFMNVGSQYNLQELFRELKEKEGVESIDDVLKKVITPNGISFNEIKPVYRELLLKLAMTMSQDEIFQRSKNIIAQEKKKKKSKDKKDSSSSQSVAGSAVPSSGSNTLSSFFKLTFSSKSGSGKKAKKDKLAGSRASTASEGNGTPQSSKLLAPPRVDGASAAFRPREHLDGMGRVHGGYAAAKTINKADIAGPLSAKGDGHRARSSTSARPPSKGPPPPPTVSSRVPPPQTSEDDDDDEIYSCCSLCRAEQENYESLSEYGTCSCRHKILPPEPYRAGPVHDQKNGPFANVPPPVPPRGPQRHESESSDSFSECDGVSCDSSEKCYCYYKSNPATSGQHRTRVAVHGEDGEPVHTRRTSNNTTIIHCNGDGDDTIRSSSSVDSSRSSLSNSSSSSSYSCSPCNAGAEAEESGSTATDTTCYSISHHPVRAEVHPTPMGHRHSSHSSLLSGCDSPQTAWRRNAKMVGFKDGTLSRASLTSSCPNASSCPNCGMLNSPSIVNGQDSIRTGGSLYGSAYGGGGGGSSSAYSRLSAPPAWSPAGSRGEHPTSSVGGTFQRRQHHHLGGGGGRTPGPVRRASSKVLLLSATDTRGNVSS